MTEAHNPPAGWYPDPSGTGRRYWDGTAWTANIDERPRVPVPPAASASAARPASTWADPTFGTSGPLPVGPPASPVGATGTGAPRAGFWQRLDGPLVVIGAAVVIMLSTVLPWFELSATVQGIPRTSSENAWSSDAPWVLSGPTVAEARSAAAAGIPDSATPAATFIFPLAFIAGALAVLARQQRQQRLSTPAWSPVLVIVVAVLLLLLTLAEVGHLGSWVSDFEEDVAASGTGLTASGGPQFGLWLATAAAIAMVVGAVANLVQARRR